MSEPASDAIAHRHPGGLAGDACQPVGDVAGVRIPAYAGALHRYGLRRAVGTTAVDGVEEHGAFDGHLFAAGRPDLNRLPGNGCQGQDVLSWRNCVR